MREALHMPTLVATRFNRDLKAVYDRLTAAGKLAKVAITAVMRKFLLLANAIVKDAREWTPKMGLTITDTLAGPWSCCRRRRSLKYHQYR